VRHLNFLPFAGSSPVDSSHFTVQQLKGVTSRLLRAKFTETKRRVPTFGYGATIASLRAVSLLKLSSGILRIRKSNRKLHRQIDIAAQIWNHRIALHKRY